MQTWEMALLGFFGVLALGIMQVVINTFMSKKTNLEAEKLDRIDMTLKSLDSNITEMRKDINKLTTNDIVKSEKLNELERRIRSIESKQDALEKDFNSCKLNCK